MLAGGFVFWHHFWRCLKERKESLEIGQIIPCLPHCIGAEGECQSWGGEPRGEQHLLGCVPSKEVLRQGVWHKASATQRTVLLWHWGTAVSKDPSPEFIVCLLCLRACPRLNFFYFVELGASTREVPMGDGTHLWKSDTASYWYPLEAGDLLWGGGIPFILFCQWSRGEIRPVTAGSFYSCDLFKVNPSYLFQKPKIFCLRKTITLTEMELKTCSVMLDEQIIVLR